MKITIAIDSFKGSLTSEEAGKAVKNGILKADKNIDVTVLPLADGGEGTFKAISSCFECENKKITVTNTINGKTTAEYSITKDGTAIMEMAQAAGITMSDLSSPGKATTYGVGEIISDAYKNGCRNFIIGIGGSGTIDCGLGMLRALGYRFEDANGNEITDFDSSDKICSVKSSENPLFQDSCKFTVACDVNNPLCGKNGQIYIYGAQKGVKPEQMDLYDKKSRHFAEITKQYTNTDKSEEKGAGASGGLGFAFMSYFKNVTVKSGGQIVNECTGLEEHIKQSDLVITGEGRLDSQTAMGKAPVLVARTAKKYGKKVIALAGCVTDDADKLNNSGIDAFFPILNAPMTLSQAMDKQTAEKNLERTAEQIMKLIK